MDILTREEFVGYLRDALGHLHNADRLRHSPLAIPFGVSDQFDVGARLRNILTDGIQSLKPLDDAASEQAWRIYDSLFCCYVQQLSQRVASDQLGISPRQLRREQRVALEALADVIWPQIDHGVRLGAADGSPPAGEPTSFEGPTLTEELAWLQEGTPSGPTDIRNQLIDTLALVEPLADQHAIRVSLAPGANLPQTAAHPVAVSQALLNLLSVAIARTPAGGEVRLAAKEGDWHTEITLQGDHTPAPTSVSGDSAASLKMSYRLAELCGGRLVVSSRTEAFGATLSLPGYQQLPILAIDDNADTLQLMQRYVLHTRYRLMGTREPVRAVELAESQRAQIIVLDVMMPNVDGWHVLGQLLQHPRTRQIPVIVCTILPQEALALSLGARGFIRKPMVREAFLTALDRQSELLASEHC